MENRSDYSRERISSWDHGSCIYPDAMGYYGLAVALFERTYRDITRTPTRPAHKWHRQEAIAWILRGEGIEHPCSLEWCLFVMKTQGNMDIHLDATAEGLRAWARQIA